MLLTNLPAMIVVFRILIKSLIFLFYWMRLCIVVNWPNAASIRHFTLWLVLAEDTFIVMQLCPRSFFFSKYFSSKNSNHCTLGWFSSVATAQQQQTIYLIHLLFVSINFHHLKWVLFVSREISNDVCRGNLDKTNPLRCRVIPLKSTWQVRILEIKHFFLKRQNFIQLRNLK